MFNGLAREEAGLGPDAGDGWSTGRAPVTVAVLCKWCPDPADVEVRPDGTISTERAAWEVSEYDRVAVEVGAAVAQGTRLVVVSAGGRAVDTSLARKSMLSRGPDQLFLVVDERLDGADSRQTGAALAAAVERLGDVDLVVCGAGSADLYAQQVGIQVGERLGWPTLNEVQDVGPEGADGALRIERRRGAEIDVLVLSRPVVLAVTADAAVPRVPGMRDILAAGKRPTTLWSLDDLGPAAVVPPSTTVRAIGAPPAQERRRTVFRGDAADSSAELVTALQSEGLP